MSIAEKIGQGIRMAGQDLGAYLTNPKTAAALGKQVAMETAVGTALGQGVPRLLGQTPSESPLQTVKKSVLHAGISAPIGGGLAAMGVPKSVAGVAGSVAGILGSNLLSRPIDPEPNDQPQAYGQDFAAIQHFNAQQEQQRYNNEIALALAKNYHSPTTTIVHKNPSAEFETIQKMLGATHRY